ncbi:Protein of unknown function [Halopseudomonas formosensis]|uniref:DUF2845 domain-containing protein n=1 Tax=Halopseudomonas formosensis TaxID=1002526 RepID=A0A1I6AFW8_9GAMM|nr:DUF2845 domain-containing protein [Halopseudomonas formosensis]SFQ67551.1 Protein of unknown function [Halopseudomonas formosensis]
MKQLLCTLTLLASVLASTSAVGATMRCNDGIVSTGESTQGVLDKCGAPSSQVTDSPAIDENGFVVRGAATVKHWTYTPPGGIRYQRAFLTTGWWKFAAGGINQPCLIRHGAG